MRRLALRYIPARWRYYLPNASLGLVFMFLAGVQWFGDRNGSAATSSALLGVWIALTPETRRAAFRWGWASSRTYLLDGLDATATHSAVHSWLHRASEEPWEASERFREWEESRRAGSR